MPRDVKLRTEHDSREGEKEPYDPGPDVPDPAPLVGQVGEGATLPSGEQISRTVRELTDDVPGHVPDSVTDDDADKHGR